jgi:hypothetical protein
MSYPIGASGDVRFTRRGRTEGGLNRPGMRYPSPFFDIGHTYLPKNMKALFRWCRYYFLTDPLINASVSKMATYPITDLHFEDESDDTRNKWQDVISRTLGWRSFMYGAGLDYWGYGNAYLQLVMSLDKYLQCGACNHKAPINQWKYKFRDFQYEATCPNCGAHGKKVVSDVYPKSVGGMRLVRYNPEDIDVEYNPYNGQKRIKYKLPITLKNDIRMGKKHIIESIPDIYVQAVKNSKPLLLDKVYHFARPTIAQEGVNMGLGIPMILPVLKYAYYKQLLHKAQEMVMQEHIVPWRILFPQPGSNSSDPYSTVNLGDWKAKVEREVDKFKLDQNTVSVMPIPVGHQSIGGDGRALLVTQELRMLEESIVAGMGVPLEFVKGGISYSGTSLSMNILKNQFETYRRYVTDFLQNYVIERIANAMQWPKVKIKMKRFHMSDDLQRASLTFQLNQSAKVSDKTMLEELNYDNEKEILIIKEESSEQLKNMSNQQAQQAHMQGEAMKIQQRYQMAAQEEMQAMQPAELAAGPNPQQMQAPIQAAQNPAQVDPHSMAKQIANQISKMPEDQMYQQLKALQPYAEIHTLVMQELNQMRGRPNSAAKPLPTQKPPRRGPSQSTV